MVQVKKPVFEIHNLKKGIFLSRPNRFIAEIKYDGKVENAHVHDPGRLKELLIKGAEVLFTNSSGKLKYYVKAVKHNKEWILIDRPESLLPQSTKHFVENILKFIS